MNERYIVTAVLVAGTLIASFALAEDASQKTGTHPREMMKNAEASGKPGAAGKEQNMFKVTEPKIENRSEQPYVGIRTKASLPELPTVIPQTLDEVFAWLVQRGIAPAGAPFIRYHVINMEAQMDIELGVPVANPVQGDGRVSGGSLPAGRYATLVYTDVAKGREGNGVLVEWAKDNGIEWDRWHEPDGDAFRSRYESFLTPPDSEPDKTKWDTEVAIKLAD